MGTGTMLSARVLRKQVVCRRQKLKHHLLAPIHAVNVADKTYASYPANQYFFQLNVSWGQVMAYASMITLPVLALFLAFQRSFINSIASSGVKG